ncbi:NAD-dependent epimerase/dehydratase [Kribbella flavida DSM 17836]|uniref:NAD-dependent epimerase/dehydratase n=1 Tax=Kribbella flavida (strain DSM 17836 / JCM 10339 / NBRC 14399) TaxID=479435 RepID=D2PWB7_KRIFD|nr:NAD-dependent epimerase/dehydratase family protein [Kribbella flavida]ADB31569.1 NAD-dependent epimerase/dehydratase [Kribbella flavida DSM 17836]
MRIVITGASGNLGTALLRRLAPDGHELVGLSRRPPEDPGDVQWQAVDLTDDSATVVLRQVFEGADAVVHLAWAFQPSHDLDYLESVGVGGTEKVLRAAAVAGVPHVLHLSSIGAYSAKRGDEPVDESWPTDGVPSSPYSRHKAATERLLDEFEHGGDGPTVTRLRPGIVGQRTAGSALLRYAVPALVPAKAIGLVPLVLLDRALAVPVVHADDVADAIARCLERRAGGAFNVCAPTPVTTTLIARALSARAVHVPAAAVRATVAASWHARIQQLDPGWIDLAYAVPLMDCSRAERELDWQPRSDGPEVLRELIDGLKDAAAGRTPVLRPRTVVNRLQDLLHRGPVGERRET